MFHDVWYFWLVVTGRWLLFSYSVGNNHRNWLIFFNGVETIPTRDAPWCWYLYLQNGIHWTIFGVNVGKSLFQHRASQAWNNTGTWWNLEYFNWCKVAVSLWFEDVFLPSEWWHGDAWSGLAIAVPLTSEGKIANTFNSRLLSRLTESPCATGIWDLHWQWSWFQEYCLGLVRGLQPSHLYKHTAYMSYKIYIVNACKCSCNVAT